MSRPVRGAVHDAAVPFVKRVAERTRSKHLFVIDVIGTTVAAVVALVLWLDAAPGAEIGGASSTIVFTLARLAWPLCSRRSGVTLAGIRDRRHRDDVRS